MKTKEHDAVILSSVDEETALKTLTSSLKESSIPDDEILANLGLFLTSKNLSRILFFYEIYKMLLHTHGAIVEFGVRWGQTLAILSALRGIFEPFNRHRKIIGFDSFLGLQGFSKYDGNKSECSDKSFSVSANYEKQLDEILASQNALNPVSHIKKYDLVRGDARETVPEYFKNNPELLISLAIFDFDIYEPTRVALESVSPRLFKGSILVFDELSDEFFPGETLAVQEILGIRNLELRRFPMTSRVSYAVIS